MSLLHPLSKDQGGGEEGGEDSIKKEREGETDLFNAGEKEDMLKN